MSNTSGFRQIDMDRQPDWRSPVIFSRTTQLSLPLVRLSLRVHGSTTVLYGSTGIHSCNMNRSSREEERRTRGSSSSSSFMMVMMMGHWATMRC